MPPRPASEPGSLTYKQRLFVAAYLGECLGNACHAARKAGYSSPDQQGPQQLRKTNVRAAIDAKLATAAMPADEVMARISEFASGDFSEFVRIDAAGKPHMDLKKAEKAGKLGLIRKIKPAKGGGYEVEFYSQMDALDKLARIHGMYKDRVIIEGDDDDDSDRIRVPEVDDRPGAEREDGREASPPDGGGDVPA